MSAKGRSGGLAPAQSKTTVAGFACTARLEPQSRLVTTKDVMNAMDCLRDF